MLFDEAVDLIRELQKVDDPVSCLCKMLESTSADDVNLNELSLTHPSLPSVVNLAVSVAKKLMLDGPEKEQFYSSLWEFLNSEVLLPAEDEKAIAILFLRNNAIVPYLALPLMSMGDAEYVEYRNSLASHIEGLGHVAQRDFTQKTQEASAVLAIIDLCDSVEEKTVLLASFLSMIRDRAVVN